MNIIVILFLQLLALTAGSALLQPRDESLVEGLHDRPKPYIVGGEIVQGRQFPGQVSVQYYGGHNCGGSILNENFILTAAHCSQYKPFDLNVLSGTNILDNGGTQHNVLEIHVHEKYNAEDSWHNDIAVYKVTPPFVFDNNTAPVALPRKGQTTSVGSKSTVIGWGALSHGGEMSNDLRKVDLLIYDHEKCNKTYSADGFYVYPEQICADTPEGNKGSCQGDSGGPLIVDGEVLGIVSWTRGCAEKGFPSVYTEVADYIDWIQSKVNLYT